MLDINAIGCLFTLCILTEATVQIFIHDTPSPINNLLDYYKYEGTTSSSIIRWLSAVIGILFAFNMDIDIFQCLGYTSRLPYIGTIATGLIISRGSNYVHDLLGKLTNVEKETII